MMPGSALMCKSESCAALTQLASPSGVPEIKYLLLLITLDSSQEGSTTPEKFPRQAN